MTDDLHAIAAAAAAAADAAHAAALARLPRWGNVPAALRALPQWCYYTERKLPRSLHAGLSGWDPRSEERDERNSVSTIRPETWASWDAICAARNGNPYLIGPGFIATEQDDIVGIDLDAPMRTLEKRAAFLAASPAQKARTLAYCLDILAKIERWAAHFGAWGETSMSGKGAHIFIRGRLPEPRYEMAFGGSIYASRQYIAITGHKLPWSADDVPANQAAIDELLKWLLGLGLIRPVAMHDPSTAVDLSEEDGRRLNLTDEQVCAILAKINGASYRFFGGGAGKRGDWSLDYFALLGDLDKITGDPAQVKRIIFACPALQHAGRAGAKGKGKDRAKRCADRFDLELSRCRGSNAKEIARRKRMEAEADECCAALIAMSGATGGQ